MQPTQPISVVIQDIMQNVFRELIKRMKIWDINVSFLLLTCSFRPHGFAKNKETKAPKTTTTVKFNRNIKWLVVQYSRHEAQSSRHDFGSLTGVKLVIIHAKSSQINTKGSV